MKAIEEQMIKEEYVFKKPFAGIACSLVIIISLAVSSFVIYATASAFVIFFKLSELLK